MSTPRVKVYKLSDEGEWLDKGTGHISLEYMEVGAVKPPFVVTKTLLSCV